MCACGEFKYCNEACLRARLPAISRRSLLIVYIKIRYSTLTNRQTDEQTDSLSVS